MTEIINKFECNKVFTRFTRSKNQDDYQIINYETKPLTTVIGYMGEYYNLLIHYKKGNEETLKNANFFVKKIPSNKFDRKEIENNGAFRKEIGIYKNILREFRSYCPVKLFPECYYSNNDLLVLDNLLGSGYNNLKHENYTINHYHIVLDNLAALHTASIAYEYKNKINIGDSFGEYLIESVINSKNKWYYTGLLGIKTVAMIHPKFQNSEIQNFIRTNLLTKLSEALELVQTSQIYQNVFCHRDPWDSNIMFKFDNDGNPINCAFVDFQLSRYTPPAFDVLFFIYFNTTRNFRNKIMNNFIKYYHKSLIEKITNTNIPNPDEIISWDEFFESCETIKLVILILKGICAPICNLPYNWAADIKLNYPEKFDYYMTCNRDEMLLGLMAKHDYYRNVVYEVVEELIDYILDK